MDRNFEHRGAFVSPSRSVRLVEEFARDPANLYLQPQPRYALAKLGHSVGPSTVARLLDEIGINPAPACPTK